MSLRSVAVRALAGTLYHSRLLGPVGAAAAYARRPTGFRILTFHRIGDENDPFLPALSTTLFAARMAHIARHYVVLTVEELVERMRRGRVPRNTLALTFDDGYRNNLTHAAPILARHGLPATIFLTTRFIGSSESLWFERLAIAFKTTKRSEVEFAGERAWPLNSVTSRLQALNAALSHLKRLPDVERQRDLDGLLSRLGGAAQEPPERPMLTWEEVHALQSLNFSIGAHTETHPILSRLEPEQARREVGGSKRVIEKMLGQPVRAFAYPNGGSLDYDTSITELVAEAGFSCAVTTRRGLNTAATPLLELHRGGAWDTHVPTYALQLAYYQLANS